MTDDNAYDIELTRVFGTVRERAYNDPHGFKLEVVCHTADNASTS